jgi:hypothetical protein
MSDGAWFSRRSVLFGASEYPKAILSGRCAGVSFDPVERTEGDDTDCEKAKVKEGADRQDDLSRDRADRCSLP